MTNAEMRTVLESKKRTNERLTAVGELDAETKIRIAVAHPKSAKPLVLEVEIIDKNYAIGLKEVLVFGEGQFAFCLPLDYPCLIAPPQKTDITVAGKANCGCVYHAEDGIPCRHDIELARER